jgi:ankyrin repeat protein
MSKKESVIQLAQNGKWDQLKKKISQLETLDIIDIELAANPSVSLMDYAISQNNISAVKMLLKIKNYMQITDILEYAAKTIRFHYNSIAQILIDNNSVNYYFTKGPLIHVAVWSRNIKMLNYLLSKNADPNLKGRDRMRPLHIAVKYNEYQAFNILLKQPGIRVNTHSSPRGLTPLHEAIIVGNNSMIYDLLGAGANVNGLMYDGTNALAMSQLVKNHELRKLFLDKGANPNQMGPYGDNMVNIVLLNNMQGKQSNNYSSADLVQYLIEMLPLIDPVVLNSQNFKGYSTLYYIVGNGLWIHPELSKVLSQITWDIFQKDISGETIYDKVQKNFDTQSITEFITLIAKSYLHSISEIPFGEHDTAKNKEWETECKKLEGQPKSSMLSILKKNKINVPKDISRENTCILLAKHLIEKKQKSYYGTRRLFNLIQNIDIIIKPKYNFTPIIWSGQFAWEWLLNKYVCNKHSSLINNHFPTKKQFLKPIHDSVESLFAFVWTKHNGQEQLIPPYYLKASDLRKKGLKQFSHFPFIIHYIPGESHENSIIIDHKNKTIERFEPHGYKGAHYYNTKNLTVLLKKYFKKILPSYIFLDSKDIYPRRGVQTYEHISSYHDISYQLRPGYCAAWSAWYMDLIATNLHNPVMGDIRTRHEFINAAIVKVHHHFSSAQKYILMYLENTGVIRVLNDIVNKIPEFKKQNNNPMDMADDRNLMIIPSEGNSVANRAAIKYRTLLYQAKM